MEQIFYWQKIAVKKLVQYTISVEREAIHNTIVLKCF